MQTVKRAWFQNKALTIKSLILQYRQWKSNLAQIILPIVCLLCIFLLDKLVANLIARSLESFTPYEVNVGNSSSIDGYMYAAKLSYAQQQRADFNRSKALFTVDFEPPEFIYVSRSSNISSSELGYLLEDGTGAGFLGNMFNISGELRVSVNRSWEHPEEWETARAITNIQQTESIRVPYFRVMDSEEAINAILYDFIENGTQQLSAGAYKFRSMNLSPTSPYLKYAVLADSRGDTKFCELASVLAGRISCSAFLHSMLATQVHDTALKQMSSGQYGIMGTVAQIPYFARPDTTFYLGNFLGIFFFPVILSLMLPVFTYAIVLEKETKMREMMKLMGMRMHYYWINTYVFQYLLYGLAAVAFVVFAAIFQFNIILRTSPAIWILMLIGWGFMVVSSGILLSSILRSTLLAVVTGYVIVLLGPLAAGLLVTTGVVQRNTPKWIPILLIYPFPMVQILNAATAKCATDAKCFTPARDLIYDQDILMSTIFLFIDGFLYGLIGLYLDKILPQDWGVAAKPWFFIEWIWNNRFLRRRRTGPPKDNVSYGDIDVNDMDAEVLTMENEIENGVHTPENSGVYIRNLRKEYDDWILAPVMTLFWKTVYKVLYKGEREYRVKAAVKKLSLAIGKSECFGLLGSNGAGKSTTMNILSGIIYKTHGEAYINGLSIDDDMDEIRKRFGLCPQFDVLYDDLTVQEHLEFFARIKCVPNVQEHIKYLLKKVQLTAKKSALSKSLSGGMKRRLSIAISLVGDPSCVILDEPTTGLDPLTKRTLWDLILEAKKERCFILTTHSMEEADVLCDRIGIMTRGRMNTIGSSISLKKRFGKGFRISINFAPNNKEIANGYIKQLIPTAELHTEFVGNSIYEVEKESVKVSTLFNQMEKEKSQYGISEWSINMASLEDVFLHIARKDEEKNDQEYKKELSFKNKCAIM